MGTESGRKMGGRKIRAGKLGRVLLEEWGGSTETAEGHRGGRKTGGGVWCLGGWVCL